MQHSSNLIFLFVLVILPMACRFNKKKKKKPIKQPTKKKKTLMYQVLKQT